MANALKVVVLIDPEVALPEDPQFRVGDEETIKEVEWHVTETLRELGHEAIVQPVLPNIPDTIHALMDAAPDLVFNLTEHYQGDRRMDKNIAAVLDLLKLPYTGTGPDGLMLCRDKGLCKRLLAHRRIRVPNFVMIPPGRTTVRKKLQFPVIVKPGFEDGSDGISLASLVDNEADMKERVAMLHERMKQPVICEEFIDGREIYIGMVGNQRVRAFTERKTPGAPTAVAAAVGAGCWSLGGPTTTPAAGHTIPTARQAYSNATDNNTRGGTRSLLSS